MKSTPTSTPSASAPAHPDATQTTPDSPADERPPRRFHWAVRLLLTAVLMFANYLGLLAVLPVLPLANDPSQPPLVSLAASVAPGVMTSIVAVVLIWLVMRYVDRRPLSELGLRFDSGSIPALLLGIAVSAAVVLPSGFLLQSLGLLRSAGNNNSAAPIWMIAIVVFSQAFLLQGFPEELDWRGYLMQTLPFTNRWVVALISAATFGVMHIFSSGGQENLFERLIYIGQAFAFAFAAAALYQATGQLWAAVGIHGGLHVAFAIAALNGVGQGPWLWITQTVLYCAVAAAVLAWLDRARPDTPAAGRRLPA